MCARVVRPVTQVDVVPGIPSPADLADLWLVYALAYLLDACDVPAGDRRELVASGIDPGILELAGTAGVTGEAQLERLNASRVALVFGALAVEARLNRVLKRGDPSELQAVAHLKPAQKFRLAPRLLGELDAMPNHAALCDLVDELFTLRNELVDAAGLPGAGSRETSSRFSASHARALVEASAKACCFLATLAKEDEGVAERVRDTVEALSHRADVLAVITPPTLPRWEWGWNQDADFPPDLVGS